MSQEQHITITDELLVRYLAGEAGPDEAMAIDEWLETPVNAEAFRRLRQAWDASGPGSPYQSPDVTAEWERWQQSQQAPPVLRRIWPRWAAAAAVIVLAGSAWLFFPPSEPATSSNTVFTAATSAQQHTLPDGSLTTLQPGAELIFESHDGARIAQLTGNAAFNVKADPQDPFTLQAGPLTIRIIGTRFHVGQYADSITVSVTEGAVMAIGKSDSVLLKSGMRAVYFIGTARFLRQNTASPGIRPSKTVFEFNDTPLGEAVVILSEAYGIPVALDHPTLANCRINTAFTDKPLDYVLTVITESLRLEYRKANDTIYIYGHACD